MKFDACKREKAMKRKILFIMCILVMFFSISVSAFANRGNEFSLRVSYYDPEDSDTGFAIGGSFGSAFSDAVTLSFGTDVYFKKYEARSEVASETGETWQSTLYTTDIAYSTYAVPLMAELKANIPIISIFSVYGHIGAGYQLFWIKEINRAENVSERDFYGGWVWSIGIGPSLQIGGDTWLFFEGYYTGSTVSRNRDDISLGLPVYQEIDLSGFGIRFGISVVTF
jgi:hypothetical protein